MASKKARLAGRWHWYKIKRFIRSREVKTLTGGPLGPIIDRPGSPGAPYRQIEGEKEVGRHF